jgi:protein subunit release factor A
MPAPESPGPVHASPATTIVQPQPAKSDTAAVILSSAALAVALGGAGYVMLRVRPAIRAS